MRYRYTVYFEAYGQRIVQVNAANEEDAKKIAWENFDLAGEQKISYGIRHIAKDAIYTTLPAIHEEVEK